MSFPVQTTYPLNMPIGVAGRIADNCFKNTLSPTCAENIPAAVGVVKVPGLDYTIQLPGQNVSTVVLSADLVASNVINTTVNGQAITPVVFATSHLATMNAVAAAIAGLDGIASAVVGGANDRTITITSDAGEVTNVASFVVTLGASQATATITNTSSTDFFGVTQFVYNIPNNLPLVGNVVGQLAYQTGYPAPTLTQGRIYVVAEDIVTAESPVYLRYAANGLNIALGSFRGSTDTGTFLIPASAAKWREGNGVAGGIAVLELTLS